MINQKIRLSCKDLESICEIFKKIFTKNDSLWIFGSRVYISKKGGDIDLYIETEIKDPKIIINMKLLFLSQLKQKIGDQKIDCVIKYNDTRLLIYEIAKKEGIKIV